MTGRFFALIRRSNRAASVATLLSLATAPVAMASTLDVIGLTQLFGVDPTLNGAGVRVGQAEADANGGAPNDFEVNPAATGQPLSLFTYIGDSGQTVSFSTANESAHADSVGDFFYGTTGSGVAPGVSHVDSMSANYFSGTAVPYGQAVPDAIVNQSFVFLESDGSALTASDQEQEDAEYDNYVDEFGTIIVSAAGNGGTVNSPSTAYNVISVGANPGPSSVGPTIDDGRSKPDITAPGSATSFTTPLVSGSAAILVQAGARGDGGKSPQTEADAVDFRTVEALLLNGANKQTVTFVRTHTAPLDPTNGAGLLNIYNSYEQLAAGKFPASSQSTTLSVGGAHAPSTAGEPVPALSGWDFSTLTTSPLSDAYANYVFQPAVGVSSYTLAATLVWERPESPNILYPSEINNLDLYLYDTTTGTTVDWSNSTVDNVQDVYDLNLSPGNVYDLEVLKNGGVPGITSGVMSNSETYALAFNFAAVQSIWTPAGGGTWSTAANWNGPIPQHATDTASFLGGITAPSTVTLNSISTVGNINFNNANSYTLASGKGGGLTLDNGASSANIIDTAGNHFIRVPMTLNSNLSVNVARPADVLTISGPVSGAGGISVSGSGTVALGGINTYAGPTTVNSGLLTLTQGSALPASGNLTVGTNSSIATARLAAGAGLIAQKSVTIKPGSTLDLTTNTLDINYGSPAADPVSSILSYLTSAYDGSPTTGGGRWTGPGLTSSSAASSGVTYSLGYADGDVDAGTSAQANQVLVMYTVAGDANLDGGVGVMDLVTVARNFGETGKDWSEGNFTYDPAGSVGVADLILVLENFNRSVLAVQTDSLSVKIGNISAVPEPASGLAGLVIAISIGRRRRRTQPRR